MPTGAVASLAALFSSRMTAVFMPRWNSASKLGSLKFSTTVIGSGVSIDSIEAKKALSLLVESLAPKRSNENLTSLDGEGLAVLELDVRLEREGQRLEVGREGPFLGEQRRDREVLVDLRQPLEDVVMGDLADRRGGRRRRIEAGRLEHHADRHAVLGGREADGGDEGEGGGNQQLRCAAHERLRRGLDAGP